MVSGEHTLFSAEAHTFSQRIGRIDELRDLTTGKELEVILSGCGIADMLRIEDVLLEAAAKDGSVD